MRCALYTFCLIFMENFFLFNGYISDGTIEITSDTDLQKSFVPVNVSEEDTRDHRIKFEKLNNIIRQHSEEFVDSSSQEEISMKNITTEKPLLRHERHEKKRRSRKYHSSNNIQNERRDFEQKIVPIETTTSRGQTVSLYYKFCYILNS